MCNYISHTIKEWYILAKKGDSLAIHFVNNKNAKEERYQQSFPEAYAQNEMQEEHKYWFQTLSNYLNKPVLATGSVLRGYWRTKEFENYLSNKYDVPPKYSDFDLKKENITQEELDKANKELNPPAKFSFAIWERYIEFKPKI